MLVRFYRQRLEVVASISVLKDLNITGLSFLSIFFLSLSHTHAPARICLGMLTQPWKWNLTSNNFTDQSYSKEKLDTENIQIVSSLSLILTIPLKTVTEREREYVYPKSAAKWKSIMQNIAAVFLLLEMVSKPFHIASSLLSLLPFVLSFK